MELKFDAEYSEYLLTKITIDTAYKWGSGWSYAEGEAFNKEMRDVFTNAGYIVKEGDFACCDNLTKSGYAEELDLYMHPMEFSGYATLEQINEIVSILKNCETINDVVSVSTKQVYDLTEIQYRNILAKNSKAIIQWLNDYNRKHGNTNGAGFEFAEKYRPLMKCFSNIGGRSYDDADIEFVCNLAIIAKENGLL